MVHPYNEILSSSMEKGDKDMKRIIKKRQRKKRIIERIIRWNVSVCITILF